MVDLKIRVFRGNEPKTTVSVPMGILRIASSLVPTRAAAALKEEGIDLQEIIRLSESPTARGEIAVIEDHVKGEKTVISLE